MTSSRISLLASALVFVALPALVAPPTPSANAKQPAVYTGLVKGVAVGGYDPVAYFTETRAVEGSKSITHEHMGVVWRFASEANRDTFKADPQRYAPQYGGYCAWAVSQGYTAKGDPNAWTISNGKLYLNYNKAVQKDWEKDIPRFVRLGDANWPAVVTR